MTDLAPSYVGLLRTNRSMRRLWFGQIVSFIGDWFTLIALYDIVQSLTASALALAGVTIAKTLPVFLVTPIAGPLVDRFDRRKLMLFADYARAAMVLGLIVAHRLESLPLLYTCIVLQMGFAGLFIPARTAVIPQICAPAEVPVAMALSGGTWSVMLALGAAMGGVATQFLGADGTLLLDAATFLLSAWFLTGLPSLPARDPADGPRTIGADGFVAGLSYLRGKPYLATLLTLKAWMALAGGVLPMFQLFGNGVFYATAGPVWVGLLYAGRGLGALTGSMGVRRVFGDRPATMRRVILPAYLITSICLIGLSSAPTIHLAIVAVSVAAIGNGCCWVMSGTLAQFECDREQRGRAFALEFGLMTLSASATAGLAGWGVDEGLLDPRGVALWSGVVLLVPAALWTGVLYALRNRDQSSRSTTK